MRVRVSFEERYWYPDAGGQIWLAGYQLVDESGSFLARDAPELTGRGLWVTGVAGAARHHEHALQSDAARPGCPLRLIREPDNPHDANAVALGLADGSLVGYVPRELATLVAASIDAGDAWSAVVLREQRASPRDPRSGITALLARDSALDLQDC